MRRVGLRAIAASLLLGLALGSWSPSAEAGTTPTSFTFQAVLRNNAGALQSLQLDVFVNLWTAQTGGTEVKSYIQVVTAENGVFSMTVSDATLPAILAANSSLWYEVSVVGYGTFPRQQVTSQLFALQSGTSEALSCSGCLGMQHFSSGTAGNLSLPYGESTQTETIEEEGFVGYILTPSTPYTIPANGVCLVSVAITYGANNDLGATVVAIRSTINGVSSEKNISAFSGNIASDVWTAFYAFPVNAGDTVQFGCYVESSVNPVKCNTMYMCF